MGLHGWVHEKFGSLEKKRAEQLLYDGSVALERIGLRPLGFRAPGALRGEHTVPVLRELGYHYDSSTDPRDHSTQPALLAPRLAHVPWREEMVDSIQYLRHPVRPRTPDEMEALWRAGIDRAVQAGHTVTMVAHAFVSGVEEARFAALRNVLAYASERMDVVTARTVADRVLGGDR